MHWVAGFGKNQQVTDITVLLRGGRKTMHFTRLKLWSDLDDEKHGMPKMQ